MILYDPQQNISKSAFELISVPITERTNLPKPNADY